MWGRTLKANYRLSSVKMASNTDLVSKIHRVHIGPTKGSNIFSDKEIAVIENVLDRYFGSWLTDEGTSRRTRDGKVEKLRTITVTSLDAKPDSGKDPVNSCFRQLQGHFPTSFIRLEECGTVSATGNEHGN